MKIVPIPMFEITSGRKVSHYEEGFAYHVGFYFKDDCWCLIDWFDPQYVDDKIQENRS